jgi:hypothetical protein
MSLVNYTWHWWAMISTYGVSRVAMGVSIIRKRLNWNLDFLDKLALTKQSHISRKCLSILCALLYCKSLMLCTWDGIGGLSLKVYGPLLTRGYDKPNGTGQAAVNGMHYVNITGKHNFPTKSKIASQGQFMSGSGVNKHFLRHRNKALRSLR